ncbi:unnamed protein product [Rotaria sp. Silwood2]|nr:unnamed protein product [Rotaria sp. Silwood2]CAF4082718.1 unnamed protein product [Rotaria sp. Silwood2]
MAGMIKVWIKRDENVAEKFKIDAGSDIDDLKTEVFGQANKGQYRATYNGQALTPSAEVPQNTTDATPVLFIKIPNTTGSGQNFVDPLDCSDIPIILTNDKTNDLEIDIVRNSTISNSISLEYLVAAGELHYTDKTSKDISNELVTLLNTHPINLSKFINECLIPIMFLLKREQNLDNFMISLTDSFEDTKNSSDPNELDTFNLNLRRFIHVLLLNSDLFVRRVIMSLVSKRNPVPFVHPNILEYSNGMKYEFMSSVIHIWNHTRPAILSFGVGEQCQGKSSLLNILFLSTFEQSMNSIYFQQTIDIDFGYSFLPERPVNIADCHGEISLDLIRNIQSLFDGYLIHINEKWLEGHSNQLIEYLELLPPNKFYSIFIRDIKTKRITNIHSQCQKIIDSSNILKTRRFSIFPLMNMNTIDREKDKTIRDLRDKLMSSIKEQIITPIDKETFQNEFKALLKRTGYTNCVTEFEEMNSIIKPLKERLVIGDLENQSDIDVPLYLKFLELCKLRHELMKITFYDNRSQNSFDKYKRKSKLEEDLNPETTSNLDVGTVFRMFISILQSNHKLMNLNLLSSELKQKLLTLEPCQLSGDLTLSNSFLSLEVLWRNAMVCYNHTSLDNQHLIIESYVQYIRAGFPFEIIDGDQFNIQHQFLTEVLKHFQQQRILVISIVGPQNSGKSTLLNYMFGTLFEVRRGRCTRGVYGSFVKCNAITGIDYIMLLDTEGLLSDLKNDKEYDRRLIVFCLVVTHLMIVNVDKSPSKEIIDLLTGCTDSLKHMDVTKVLKPTVHFVLNQEVDLNIANHSKTIENIINDLRSNKLDEMIDISAETLHVLPVAFKREQLSNSDSNSPCLMQSEPVFLEKSQRLASKITESAKIHYERANNKGVTPS